jgi:DNA-binding NarL/FixJ family response regulator
VFAWSCQGLDLLNDCLTPLIERSPRDCGITRRAMVVDNAAIRSNLTTGAFDIRLFDLRIAEGKSSKEIAAQLDIALETVRSYRKMLMRKLDLNNVAELTQLAVACGITHFPARH